MMNRCFISLGRRLGWMPRSILNFKVILRSKRSNKVTSKYFEIAQKPLLTFIKQPSTQNRMFKKLSRLTESYYNVYLMLPLGVDHWK